ncbi:MAG: hypothetical protein MZV65_33180 [Chromatiales bacterium]|nr:hypothetical protein [Chromatiales bacterium]
MILAGAAGAVHAGRLTPSRASSSRASNIAFGLVLVQLMVMPDVLIVENYLHHERSSAWSTRSSASGCRTWRAAFGIFLLRQTFKTGARASWRMRRASRAAGWLGVLLARLRAAGAADLPRLRRWSR